MEKGVVQRDRARNLCVLCLHIWVICRSQGQQAGHRQCRGGKISAATQVPGQRPAASPPQGWPRTSPSGSRVVWNVASESLCTLPGFCPADDTPVPMQVVTTPPRHLPLQMWRTGPTHHALAAIHWLLVTYTGLCRTSPPTPPYSCRWEPGHTRVWTLTVPASC